MVSVNKAPLSELIQSRSREFKIKFSPTTLCLVFFVGNPFSCPANAGETVLHSYDILGRLIHPQHSGTSNNGVTAIKAGYLTFTRTVTNSYSVSYATTSGSAVSGADYNSRSGTLAFVGTESSKTIVVAAVNSSTSLRVQAVGRVACGGN
jgi:hypothetical protein